MVRRLLPALVLACVAGAAGTHFFADGEAAEPLDAPAATAPLTQEQAAQVLADRHAPIVYLRDQRQACDRRGTPYFPVEVDFLFDVEDIRLRRHQDGRTEDIATNISAADLYGLDDTYFIDTPGNPRRPGCVYERDFLARRDGYAAVAYANIATQEDHEGFALQYWLYYYFNDWNNKHEGDWEMIQLLFDGPTPADALAQEPYAAGYSQHGTGERSDWDDSKLTKEGVRPVAFIAVGANANQFEPNIILGRGDNGTGFGCDDARRPSTRLSLQARLMSQPTGPDSEYPWLTFDGRWGERAPWEFNGPTGPNDKRAWTRPFDWHEDLRPSSIIVPSGGPIGPNAVNIFCDAVWYLSTPLFVVLRLPPVVFLLGVVATGAGLVYLTTRTQYRPISAEPMRQRRRFGQVLTSAFRLYREHPAVFLLIGTLFIPVGFLEAFGTRLLFSFDLPDTIVGFFAERTLVSAMIAVALGNVASSLVYWFVNLATLSAVSRIAAGRNFAPLEDYRDVARRFRAVVVPRLKAVAIVVALAVSVVGIPWAIRHGYRWAFIEETIMLDETPSGGARAASARAVDGRWWHTFVCLLALGVAGYLIGPAVAVALLFISDLPVSTVNLISSLLFVAIAPYVGIAQAYLYFDLTERPREATP